MPNFRRKSSGWSELTRGAPLAVFVATSLLILYHLLPVVELIAIAILLALFFRTALQWLQKIVVVRWLAVMIMAGLIIGIGLFFALVMIPNLIEEAQKLARTLPSSLNFLIEDSRKLHRTFSFVPDLSEGLEQLKQPIEQIFRFFPTLLKQTFSLSLQALATVILALYMAYDPDALTRGVLRLSPRKQHWRIKKLLDATKVRLRGWIYGTGLAIIIIGIGAIIGLLVLQVPLALSLGVLAGVLEVVPYVGPIVGSLLPALIALSIDPFKALFVLIYFLILNQVDVHFIQPIVMSKRVGLNPVIVIVAFLVMGELRGLIGLLLAVPVAAVLVTLVDELTTEEPQLEVSHPEDK
ncbi:MAG: AI-2E family transporter [Coleofasciculaceae cyanobacterium]